MIDIQPQPACQAARSHHHGGVERGEGLGTSATEDKCFAEGLNVWGSGPF